MLRVLTVDCLVSSHRSINWIVAGEPYASQQSILYNGAKKPSRI